MKTQIIKNTEFANSCYFRTSVKAPYRKALLKITDWCNLTCAHCFVSAGKYGDIMSFELIKEVLLPRLVECRVISVTLTGGEPFAHPKIMEIIELFSNNSIDVSVCTNGTLSNESQIIRLSKLKNVTVNVSLDGFSTESHGKFRGDKQSFHTTIKTIELLSKYGLLKGLLCTPNNLAEISEYKDLCIFAIENGAKYVLMNPLSIFGRGEKSQKKLGRNIQSMQEISSITKEFDSALELVNIRFPNKNLPLSGCEAGNIIYVFTDGAVTVCPYLVFSAENTKSQYSSSNFIVGNIFADTDISKKLDNYNIYSKFKIGDNEKCNSCNLNNTCKKGCPAAIISNGGNISGIDKEQCPKYLL